MAVKKTLSIDEFINLNEVSSAWVSECLSGLNNLPSSKTLKFEKKEDDPKVIKKLMNSSGKKVINGGTTAQIAARELDEELETSFEYHDSDIPPVSYLKGVDLVTEGLLTLNKVLEFLDDYKQGQLLPEEKDGASQLIRLLLKSDQINFLVGRAMNESHQSLNLPLELGIRSQIVDRIANFLKELNKEVSIEWF